jgi:hypothetical protein
MTLADIPLGKGGSGVFSLSLFMTFILNSKLRLQLNWFRHIDWLMAWTASAEPHLTRELTYGVDRVVVEPGWVGGDDDVVGLLRHVVLCLLHLFLLLSISQSTAGAIELRL